jgi:FAD-linked sulfhydryl oxidase
MARRQHVTLTVVLGFIIFLAVTYTFSGGRPHIGFSDKEAKLDLGLPDRILTGGSIAPKLENATAKAELGRASWKLFHTMMAKFPDKPTDDDRLALKTYIQLFARLYPCGDCASHFQKIIAKYPPQTSSRSAAAGWACEMHNIVNKRLKKELFDCNKIGDFYDCGCGDDDKKKGANGEGKEERADVSIEKEEGLVRGG